MKRKTAYVCSDCGASALQWFGACPSCGAAGTLSETVTERGHSSRMKTPTIALADLQPRELARIPTGMEELDRALGGGLVPGQVVLLGGYILSLILGGLGRRVERSEDLAGALG